MYKFKLKINRKLYKSGINTNVVRNAMEKQILMKTNIILGLLATLVFISCKSDSNNSVINPKEPELILDKSLIKDEKSKADHFYSNFYILNKDQLKGIPIDSLILNFDSLQFKVWYISELMGYRELYIFQKTKSGWKGFNCEMQLKFSTDTPSLEEINGPRPQKIKKITEVIPKQGWQNLIDSLQILKIMALPDMDIIPGLIDNWDDGYTYYFEVATKEKFRFYRYHMASKFAEKYWQAKNAEEIWSLLYREFKH